MRRPVDTASIVGGIVVATFGVILLLDATGALRLRFSAFGPIAAAMVGATLLATGLTRRG
jgi:hypothetical protein